MRNKWRKCLILVLVLTALAIPALAQYSVDDVVKCFLERDMGNVRWKGEFSREGAWASYRAEATIDGHEYYFSVEGGHENGEDAVYAMGLSGWYPDLEQKGRQSGGIRVYKAFLETLIRFVPDQNEVWEIFNPEKIYDILRGGYSFNYQPQKWSVRYNPQYCWIEAYNKGNQNFISIIRRLGEDEVTLTNHYSFFFNIN